VLAGQGPSYEGSAVRADEAGNLELFWALRGCGGSIAVVAFEYRARPVGPDVVGGQLIFPIGQAVGILGELPVWMATAAREPGPLVVLVCQRRDASTLPDLRLSQPHRGSR
jgi:hypothetical protein